MFNLLAKARALGASDVHLAAGRLPVMRLQGDLQPLGEEVMTQSELEKALKEVLGRKQLDEFLRTGEVDAAFFTNQGDRCRLNIYQQSGGVAVAVRLLTQQIPSCEQLGLPLSVQQLTQLESGLILVTGSTGSGKSTTLAALVQKINSTCAVHVLTLEDPVEYVYPPGKALINQREVGKDTQSFAAGLRSALRQDPDVILVGELRDAESVAMALTAAETGHLVLATLHTQDVTSCVTRILELLPDRQREVRTQLAECLQAVVCQRLLPCVAASGRVAAFEVLIATPALRNLIREGHTQQLYSYMQTGRQYGMITMEESLKELKRRGVI